MPGLRQLAVSSLYLDDPSRGLPFHFHLAEAGPGAAPRQPLVELQPLAGLASLERLHLNASYPPRLAAHEFSLPQLLVREFPALRELSLDNFLGRGGSGLSYTFQRTSFNRRLQWLLHQYGLTLVTINLWSIFYNWSHLGNYITAPEARAAQPAQSSDNNK